jgi:hypothetical protein
MCSLGFYSNYYIINFLTYKVDKNPFGYTLYQYIHESRYYLWIKISECTQSFEQSTIILQKMNDYHLTYKVFLDKGSFYFEMDEIMF